jgi:hypothetical protein
VRNDAIGHDFKLSAISHQLSALGAGSVARQFLSG